MLKDKIEWKESFSGEEWDNLLAKHNGHPLQSFHFRKKSESYLGVFNNFFELLGVMHVESNDKIFREGVL